MSTTTEKMERNAQKYRGRLQEIRSDWTKSDEAKRQDLQTAYEDARSIHARLEDEYRTEIRQRLRETRKAAFAAPRISGSDKTLQLMSYRDALDRTSKMSDPANSQTCSPGQR